MTFQEEAALLEKANYTEPCKRCGLCCSRSLCPAAEVAFKGETAPCRALIYEYDQASCGLVLLEKAIGLEPMMRRMTGLGCGCSMPDNDTSIDDVKAFDMHLYQKVYGNPEREI